MFGISPEWYESLYVSDSPHSGGHHNGVPSTRDWHIARLKRTFHLKTDGFR